MMGIVEMLRLVSADGDAVVVNSPVYPPFYSFVEHMNRKIVESPLAPTAVSISTSSSRHSRR